MRTILALPLLSLAACATAQLPAAPEPGPASGPNGVAALPPMVVAVSKTVLHLPEDPQVRVAEPKWKTPLEVREVSGDRVLVEVNGPIQVTGATALESLAVEVCEPGPVGEHFYAGNGNLLRLRSTIQDGRIKVAGEVAVREVPASEKVAFLKEFRRIPFEAELEVTRLCAAPQPPRHAGTAEDPHVGNVYGQPNDEDFPKDRAIVDVEPNQPLALLDAPGGQPLHTFPALPYGHHLIRLRTEGEWDLVAAGGGPYLLGWIPHRPTRVESTSGGVVGGLGLRSSSSTPFALHARHLESQPLHEVPEGTEVQHFGIPRARFNKPGVARVGKASGRWSYVTAAVDDEVTVFGWVETAKLGPARKD